MAINPELITTIRVDQLPDGTLNLTNKIPHTSGTVLEKASVQELVDLVATAIGVSGGVGYIAISVTDGQQLPDVPELPSFFLCGAGTFLNINGYPNIICTENLNAIMSLTDHWELAVEIPINPLSGTVESVTGSAVDNTDPLNPVINITGGAQTLQEVLDNNHDLVDGNNFQGTDAGINNIGSNVNALGFEAAKNNEGASVNAFGSSAASDNIGININALGVNAGLLNEGWNLNVFGENAGIENTFNNVNLFGQSATADEDGQTVLSKDGTIMARISTTDLTASRKYNLPDADGTLALTSDIPTLQEVTDEGNETTNAIKANQLVTQTSGSAKSMTLSSTNVQTERIAEWQDKDYTGIADITDIPTLVAGTNISIDDTDPLNPIISSSGGGVTSVGLTMPSAFSVTNSPITSSGDIAVTGAGLVSQYVRGDGSLANFPASTGGGASLSFYLNGSVSQGTIGGIAFREMDRTPILGGGTDFTINANGYIQSFITDANVPNLLEIPAGNWNFETYFSASSGGGSPSFYVELYKWNGTTLSLIASNSATPEGITNGTAIDAYFSALAVPQTTLLATDRLAIRIYVTHSGRTITLHTEDNHLCQVITTFSTGLTALNGLTQQVQNLAVGTSGTDFAISSASATHTFNLPTASATNRGALSSTDWSAFNGKQATLVSGTNIKTINGSSILGSGDLVVSASSSLTVGTTPISSGTIGRVFFQGSGNVLQQSASLFWDNTNARLGVGATPATTVRLDVRAQGALSTDIAFRVRNSADSANLVTVQGNGNVGIGTATPEGRLHTFYSNFSDVTVLERTPSFNSELAASTILRAGYSSSPLTGGGPSFAFQLRVLTNIYDIASFGAAKDGSDNSGYLSFATVNAGVQDEKMQVRANGNVIIQNGGTFTNLASAILNVNSTTKGFLPPRMTTTQKNAIASPAAGLIVYDTTTNKACCYNGTSWNDLF